MLIVNAKDSNLTIGKDQNIRVYRALPDTAIPLREIEAEHQTREVCNLNLTREQEVIRWETLGQTLGEKDWNLSHQEKQTFNFKEALRPHSYVFALDSWTGNHLDCVIWWNMKWT